MNKSRPRNGLSFYIILIVAILLSSMFMTRLNQPDQRVLSSMEADIANGRVKSVVINGNELQLVMRMDRNQAPMTFSKTVSPLMVPQYHRMLQKALSEGKIESFDYTQPADLSGMFNIILLVLMIGSMVFFVYISFVSRNQDGRSAMNFGRSRAKKSNPQDNKISFDDVAGADEEKEELQEVVDFLKNPKKYTALGAKIPSGILLVGPPGTGKTLLARAVAGEAGVPFFTISGSDFVEMFVGVGASRVRDLFNDAKKQVPCIIFIDEIDAVGRHRGAGLGGGHDEREQTLNQLLVEMDGFGPNEGIIVMAATNRPDILDPALLRPGRFDRRITVNRPDVKGRFEILKVHAKGKPIAENVDLEDIAKITPGYTGADLENLLNEAALLAARKGAKVITYSDISEAVFKIALGPEKKSRVMSDEEKNLTAYHEAGHAIVSRQISDRQQVERVSIIPAGPAGGYTAYKPHEDISFETKHNLYKNIMIGLGGRAAEELTQADISTGASDDLQKCNATAREMVAKYGMTDRIGLFVTQDDGEVFVGMDYGHTKKYSEQTAAAIDEEVTRILGKAYQDTIDLLKSEDLLLHKLAEALLAKEKIEGPEFEEIYKQYAKNYKTPKGGEARIFISELAELGHKSEDAHEEAGSDQDTAQEPELKPQEPKAEENKETDENKASKDSGETTESP